MISGFAGGVDSFYHGSVFLCITCPNCPIMSGSADELHSSLCLCLLDGDFADSAMVTFMRKKVKWPYSACASILFPCISRLV